MQVSRVAFPFLAVLLAEAGHLVNWTDHYEPEWIRRRIGRKLKASDRADGGIDLRVSKGLGPKGYGMVRVSVIDPPSDLVNYWNVTDTIQYNNLFQKKWNNGHWLSSSILEMAEGNNPVTMKNVHFNVKLPGKGKGTKGFFFADPCLVGNQWCKYGNQFDTWNSMKMVVNALGSDDEIDWWGILGDNFYDQNGGLTQQFWADIETGAKSKIFMTVMGNHDMWIGSAPPGSGSDQYGIGMMQWYPMDTVAARDDTGNGNLFNWNIDSRGFPNEEGVKNHIYYNQIGNMGFLGFNGAYPADVSNPYFMEACKWFGENSDSIQHVHILGHWDATNLGCQSGMNTPEVYWRLAGYEGCKQFADVGHMYYHDGHNHCNKIQGWNNNGDAIGFMIGAAGMSGCGQFGFEYIRSTDDGSLEIIYFALWGDGHWDRSTRDGFVSCVMSNGIDGCLNYGTVWRTAGYVPPAPPSPPTPTPGPGSCTPDEGDPWSTHSFVQCCSGSKECLRRDAGWAYRCQPCQNSCPDDSSYNGRGCVAAESKTTLLGKLRERFAAPAPARRPASLGLAYGYVIQTSGICRNPITTLEECTEAAQALSLIEATNDAERYNTKDAPRGCVFRNGRNGFKNEGVMLNRQDGPVECGVYGYYDCICHADQYNSRRR